MPITNVTITSRWNRRRYSSTAVGFPIRDDQKPDKQAICNAFPSGTPARTHALTPVRTDTETPQTEPQKIHK